MTDAGAGPFGWLEPLFRPRSIAIVGASNRAGSSGANLVKNLLAADFPRIYPVNPNEREIQGLRAYASVDEIGAPIDAVFIAVAAERGGEALRRSVAAGARAALVSAANYAEAGSSGAERQAELARIARAAGIPLCGPNNLGIVNVANNIPLWTGVAPAAKRGPVAIISQSGSIALSLIEDVLGLGLAYVVTVGNEAVCGVGDYLDALADATDVTVILLFLETLRDADSVARAARKAIGNGKSVVAVKVGRSDKARAAVEAHSGALAGEDALYDAFFRKHGIVRAADIDELVQLARLLMSGRRPAAGTEPVFMTLSGGIAAAIADFAADFDLALHPIGPVLKSQLARSLPKLAALSNPIDVWNLGWDAERFAATLATLIAEPSVDPIVVVFDAPAGGRPDAEIALQILAVARAIQPHDKHVIFLTLSGIGGLAPALEAACREAGQFVLRGAGGGVGALARWLATKPPEAEGNLPGKGAVAATAAGEVKKQLTERGVIAFAASRIADTGAAAVEIANRLGYPVAIKGLAPGASHKTELGLVRVNLRSDTEIAAAFADVQDILVREEAHLGPGAVEVQKMIEGGVELLVAVRRDSVFGLVAIVGAGGVLAELIDSTAVRLGVVDAAGAREMLDETRIGKVLSGYRGRRFDGAAAATAISNLSAYLSGCGDAVTSIEINPLIVLAEGKGAFAVDLLVE